jgi:hypothetical protein
VDFLILFYVFDNVGLIFRRTDTFIMEKKISNRGIIVGCDAKLEFLLPYFYLNFRLNSDLPIVFFDFGMTFFGRKFCEARGEVVSIEDSLSNCHEDEFMNLIRHSWFKKPLAFQRSPFELTLWLDIDCKILKPLDELFDQLQEDQHLAAYEESYLDESHNVLNSGVVVYKKGSPFLDKWINLCKQKNELFFGDQDALTLSLKETPELVKKLDQKFNNIYYSVGYNRNIESVIIHHVGAFKCFMQKEYLILEKSPQNHFEPCIVIPDMQGKKIKFLKANLAQ